MPSSQRLYEVEKNGKTISCVFSEATTVNALGRNTAATRMATKAHRPRSGQHKTPWSPTIGAGEEVVSDNTTSIHPATYFVVIPVDSNPYLPSVASREHRDTSIVCWDFLPVCFSN